MNMIQYAIAQFEAKKISLSEAVTFMLEQHLFHLADRQIVGYAGGQWEKTIENGVVIFLPPMDVVEITNCDNYYSGTMDKKTAGMALGCLVYNRLLWYVYETQPSQLEVLRELEKGWAALREAASNLPQKEASEFFGYID